MKKIIWAIMLCVLVSISAFAFAEERPQEVELEGFTLALSKVTMDSGKLTIRLHADYKSEADGKRYDYFILPENPYTGDVETHFDGFLDMFSIVAASFKTTEGEPFLPDGSYESYEFGGYTTKELKNGIWRRDVRLTVNGFKTDAEAVLMELHILHQDGNPAYKGEPAATLYIPL